MAKTFNEDLTYNVGEIMREAHREAKRVMSGKSLWRKASSFNSYAECFAEYLKIKWATAVNVVTTRRNMRDGNVTLISAETGAQLVTDGPVRSEHYSMAINNLKAIDKTLADQQLVHDAQMEAAE